MTVLIKNFSNSMDIKLKDTLIFYVCGNRNRSNKVINTLRFGFIIYLLSNTLILSHAHGQEITELSKHGVWTAYSYSEDIGKVCYMASKPSSSMGKYKRRGDIFALLTHRPNEKSNNVISIITGYPYKENSEVNVKIGSSKYVMFTVGQRAWNRDEQTDEKMVKSMIRGANMTIKGTSSRGTLTTDIYSLNGFTAAHRVISKFCGIQ